MSRWDSAARRMLRERFYQPPDLEAVRHLKQLQGVFRRSIGERLLIMAAIAMSGVLAGTIVGIEISYWRRGLVDVNVWIFSTHVCGAVGDVRVPLASPGISLCFCGRCSAVCDRQRSGSLA